MNGSAVAPSRAGHLVTTLTIGSFLLGAFWPTSVDGVFHPGVTVAYAVVGVGILAVLRMAMEPPAPVQIIGTLLFWAGILLGTASSPFAGEYSPGLLPMYAGLTLLLLVGPYRLPRAGLRMLRAAIRSTGLVYAIWAGGILLAVPPIQSVTITYFPAHYQELVSNMVLRTQHPVTAWGSHSIAALAYFLLFLYFRHDATTAGGRLSGFLAVFWVGALFSLRSNSGLFFGTWGLALLLAPFLTHVPRITQRTKSRQLALVVTGIIGLTAAIFWDQIVAAISAILVLEANGFSGRYSSGSGRIYATLMWIRDHPLSPIGLSYSPNLVFGDSGYVEYFLRGSLLSLVGVYLAFTAAAQRFLGRTLLWVHVCCAVMAFELGFSALPLWRLQLFLVPILVAMHASLAPESTADPCERIGRKALLS